MKPVEHARGTLSEIIRGLVYPIVPIVGVFCVWMHAYAASLESKLERDQFPRDDDSYLRREIAERHASKRAADDQPVAGLHIVSIDEQP